MKTSTKYAVLGAVGLGSVVGGAASVLVNIYDNYVAAREFNYLANKIKDSGSRLVKCLETSNNFNDCDAISSEFKTVSNIGPETALNNHFALKQKESSSPWLPSL